MLMLTGALAGAFAVSTGAAAKEITKADTVTAKLKDDSKSPQTGDTSNLALWIALLFVSGGAVTATTIYGRKNKRSVK